MCGIFALISNKVITDDKFRRTVLRMSQLLRHRGPDGTGYYQSKNACFAHERLSIIDPEGGNQPILNSSNNLVLCVNGEIFNYKALREKYSSYQYKTGSDCEVILAIYEDLKNSNENGAPLTHKQIVSILDQLDGQFSFILHDEVNQMTLVARDPFGITQCYYGMDKYGNIQVASEMKALKKCVRVCVMPAGNYLYFNNQNPDVTPKRYFAETKNGSWLDALQSGEVQYGYTPTSPHLNAEEEAHLLTTIRSTFEKAVVKRLMTDVPFGVLLSGGLDSSLVASCVMKYMKEHPEIYGEKPVLHTFSIGDYDSTDLPKARAVAEFLGTHHHEIRFTVEEGINSLHDVIYHLETYDITTIRASTPMYLLTRKIQSLGVKMVFSGEMSDELFGSYLYFHQAPSDEEHQVECKMRVMDVQFFDNLRSDKATMANSVEGRFPFQDTEFINLIINLHKDIKTQKGVEKYILRKAFDLRDETGRPIYLPDEVLWRQKEQFSDSVTYRWIDTLRQFTLDEVNSKHSVAFKNKDFLYPYNTPSTPEAFYYRQIYDGLFPGREKTVKLWIPNTRWKGVNPDPSGRAQIVHEQRYDYVKDLAAGTSSSGASGSS